MKTSKVDVIFQQSYSGEVIPLKIRVHEEDGEMYTYSIRSFRENKLGNSYTTEDGIFVSGDTRIFECIIVNSGMEKRIRLYFECKDSHWIFAA